MHWCAYNAGSHAVESNAILRVLDREILDCRIQASLRNHRNGAIGAGDWPVSKRGSNAHDTTRLLLQHLSHRVLSHVEESEQIRGDQGVEILDSEVSERLVKEDARVIHQNIDASKIADRRFDSIGSRLLLPDIAFKKDQAARSSQLLIWVARGCDDDSLLPKTFRLNPCRFPLMRRLQLLLVCPTYTTFRSRNAPAVPKPRRPPIRNSSPGKQEHPFRVHEILRPEKEPCHQFKRLLFSC